MASTDTPPARPGAPELTPDLDSAPVPVRAFLSRLRQLPLGAWDAASGLAWRAKEFPDSDSPVHRRARARLRAILDGHPLLVKWVRGEVADLAAVAASFVPSASPRMLRRVALLGALALAARPWLTEGEFLRLYEPFRGLIPPDDLLH